MIATPLKSRLSHVVAGLLSHNWLVWYLLFILLVWNFKDTMLELALLIHEKPMYYMLLILWNGESIVGLIQGICISLI